MKERVVLIGADTPSLKAALVYLQKNPEAEVTVLYPESNPLPEFICASVDHYLSRGMHFSEQLRAFGINRNERRVLARNIISGRETYVEYDKLVFASGAAPEDLNVPGEHLRGVFRVGSHHDARRLRPMDETTVVVGGGTNMLLAVSTLLGHGKGSISVILPKDDMQDGPVSQDLFGMICHSLETDGVTFLEGSRVERIETVDSGLRVVTDNANIDAARIINASDNVPVTDIAALAGLELDRHGAIVVDTHLRSSDPNIFACGSCAAFATPMCHIPIPGMGIRSTEPRQTSVLAESLTGGNAELKAPACAYAITFGDLTVAGAGLTVDMARRCGFTPMSATAIQFDRAHFMPNAELMTLELVFDGPTRRVLGIQGLGKSGDALCGRISAVSAILGTKPTIEDISNLEIAYSPPFASAMDVLNTVANVADNMLAGINEGISASEFLQLWEEREENNHFFLDCREIGNAQPILDRHPLHWNHIPQGEVARRLEEVPTDRKIILLCNTGTRSYEAQVLLKHAGRDDVVNVDGGMTAVRQTGGNI